MIKDMYQEFSVNIYIFGSDDFKHVYKNHITFSFVNKYVYINRVENV